MREVWNARTKKLQKQQLNKMINNKYINVQVAERIFNTLTNIDPLSAAPYLLLLHIYMLTGQNDKANKIRDIMTQRGVKKIPGIVYHEDGKNTYQFISGAITYPLFNEVEKMREEIYRTIKSSGYEADTRWVTNTQSMTDEEKLNSLCRHAEKLAIAHAFVLNPKRKSIILSSNIRMCNDCHNATAFISKVMKCEIIVRDSNRYHHFKDGKCSCDNYW